MKFVSKYILVFIIVIFASLCVCFIHYGFGVHLNPDSLKLRIVQVVELNEEDKYYIVEEYHGFMRGWVDVNEGRYDNKYDTVEQAKDKIKKIERQANGLTRTIVE